MSVSSSIARILLRWARPSRASVLHSLNHARAALGIPLLDELPKGQPCKYNACPISRALPGVVGVDGVAFAIPEQALVVANVWGTSVEVSTNGVYIARLPRKLRHFVRDFDLGAFPELRAKDRLPIPPASQLPSSSGRGKRAA